MTFPEHVKRGFAAGAESYQRARPSYPPALLEVVRRNMGGALGAALDLGAGTGKFTAVLDEVATAVYALEYVPEMVGQLANALPRVQAVNGDAHQLPFRSSSMALVSAATAFHWFNDAAAREEIARVLAPDGAFLTVANRRVPVGALELALEDLLDEYRPKGRPDPGGLSVGAPFSLVDVEEVRHVNVLDAEGVLELVASMSYVASLPGPERLAVISRARALMEGTAGLELAYVVRAELHRPS